MKMNMGGRVTPHDQIVQQDDQWPRNLLSRAIGVTLTVLAFVASPAFAQFAPGQVLRAVDLNNSISKPAIIGGSIDGAPIGATTPNSGKFTSLSATGAATLNSLSSSGATITGGSINGAPIGQSTPAAGAFTSLAAASGVFTGQVSLGGSAGAEALRAVTAASAVNWVQVSGAITGNGPILSAQGSDTNVNLNLQGKNSGSVVIGAGGGTQAVVANVGSAVNYLQLQGAATGGAPAISAQGSDSNVNLVLGAKSAGAIVLTTSGVTQAAVTNTPSANRYLTFTGSNGGNPTIGASAGSVAISPGLDASPIGAVTPSTGAFTTLAASGAFSVSYPSPTLTINDSAGSSAAYLNFGKSGSTAWSVHANSAGGLYVDRYVSGSYADTPFSISTSTGLATLVDGLSVTGTVSGSGFDNYITSANTRGLIDSMTNAKAYGALGNSNGSHGNGNDDTTALQNALNASANGILHIPCGTYRITASLVESSTNNYWIKGDGQCTKIFNDSATPVSTFVFNPSSPNGNVNPTVRVEGIYFYNPYVTGAGQTAVSFVNEERPYFLNNIIYGYQVGVNFTSTYAPVIDHNTFFRTVGSAIDCSIDTSCNSATISQNGFFTNGLVNSAPAINLNTPSSLNAISITGNDMEANYSGILFSNVFGAVVSGNYIENQTACNLCFNSGNSSIDFNGNWLGASPSLTLTNGLSNSTFQYNATYNYAITQGTSTSVRQINNTAVGTGGISLPTVGQLNSNTTSGTSMTSNTPTNCTSITLPAGTWDVSGSVQFSPASTTVVNYMHSSISLTSATVAPQPNRADVGGISATGNTVGSMSLSTPVVRETFATSTPVYLVGNSTFSTSSMACNGYIRAVLVQ
ncbi:MULTISPECIES: beta strand repeat-containing protein [Burkholderia]|uniref:beta strand repeat-containing protein n=1 Tax=Burkholderia TaxID=32008 RepID=UPI0011774BC1|nr:MULTISPECIES: hypothetical protein [Burkholderia]MBY4724629.1 hypothetical protein [Burkholderia contaminans]MCI3972920.1 hypothetical protein [Burkholderia sp. HI4860]MDN7788670.1 hypothetical protein [Burkholderia contaminans]